ncbi:MAG TPA: hypothetical protein VFB61_16675 [Gemmatimonadales bacterium]|nr:hypothetical protein [Gemmatimonadales bacterium]
MTARPNSDPRRERILRIIRDGGVIRLTDRVGPYWALGLFLLAGGLLGLAFPLGLASDAARLEPWERAASMVIGVAVSAGALWWLARNPRTQVTLDLSRRSLLLVRVGITGWRVRQHSFDQLERVELERGADSDGDPIWRPRVRLRNGGVLLLSQLWSHEEAEVRRDLGAVAQACRVAYEDAP